MKSNELEPGMVLHGPYGQTRQLLTINGGRCQYLQMSEGSATGHGTPKTGGKRRVYLETLARWAVEEIKEWSVLEAGPVQEIRKDGRL